MPEPVSVSFAVTRSEYAMGARAELMSVMRFGAIAGIGLLATGVVAKIDLLTGIGVMAVVAALAAWFLPWWHWAMDTSLHAEERWTADDAGLTIERASSRHQVAWAFYRELVEAGPVFAFLGDRGATDVLPKRVNGARELVDLAAAHVAVRERARTEATGGWTD